MPVFPLSNNALKRFGELKAEFRRTGQPVADFDLLIASIALTEGSILITNNIRHYDRIPGLQIETWNEP